MSKTRFLGPFEVGAIGFGGMNLSHAYGAGPPPAAAAALIARALDLGVDHFDTAALYGFGLNEELLAHALAPHRQRITLATKGGMAGVEFADGMRRVIDGRPEAIRRDCESSLRRLRTDHIDIYYLHRWDKQVPIEDSVGELARLVTGGKVRALGLSEVSAATLRRAHAVHPIAAVQSEYSLWSRNAEIAVLDACRELGTSFVAFSPIGRGFLSGRLRVVTGFDAKDIRRSMPRFTPQNYAANLGLLEPFGRIAERVGCTMAQLAIAWLLGRGNHVLPLPGTTSIAHLEENLAAAAVVLDAETVAELDAVFAPGHVVGARYNAQNQAEVDTEVFA